MSFPVNLLRLPQDKFCPADIHIGNLVSQEVAKQGKGLKVQYDPVTHNISILNTSVLPPSILDEILYGSLAAREYDQWKWYPVVEKERDANGNFKIIFSCLKPGSDTSGRESARTALPEIPALSSLDSADRRSVDDLKQMSSVPGFIPHRTMVDSSVVPLSVGLEEAVDQEEVARVSKAVADGLVATMTQFFNKHDMGNGGIWYPDDYSKYLRDEMDSEMDPSFFTGYANSKFFEKMGRFTFRLKENENASDAIRSFLEGPTVADCSNAIIACYYKCILDVVGDDKFNQIFNSSSDSPLIIGQTFSDEPSSILIFVESTTAAKQRREGVLGKRPLRIGDTCHFAGVFWYANKHPEGFGGGWNVIYIGDDVHGNQLFTAHGFKKPLTEGEINQQFIELYNRDKTARDEQYAATAENPRLYGRTTSQYLIEHYTISAEEAEKDPKRFIKGFCAGSVVNLNSEVLVRLKNSQNVGALVLKLKEENLT